MWSLNPHPLTAEGAAPKIRRGVEGGANGMMLNPAEEGGHPRACEAQGDAPRIRPAGRKYFKNLTWVGLIFIWGQYRNG
jgi:hypothetical protein